MEFEVREREARTEMVFFRVTPAEKLKLLREARKAKFKGKVSNVLREALASSMNDKSASNLAGEGALVSAN